MERKKGKFVMVEGIDGAGKGVAVNGLKQWAEDKKMKVLDLREYWKHNEGFPDIDGYDAIITCEPTYTGTGKKIREEMIREGTNYSPIEIAQAFSEDRKELYERIVLPAIGAGKHIFQERGVVSSIVYQPMTSGEITIDGIMGMEGNRFCLDHPPDILIISYAEPAVVMERLDRRKKKDDAVFEKLEFLKKTSQFYLGEWLKEFFENKGTVVKYIDTNPPSKEGDTMKSAGILFEDIL